MNSSKKRLFLSYCHNDMCFAELVEKSIGRKLPNIEITRDIRDVDYRDSFRKFMQGISTHDFVITLVSDHYLKSRNCMYEICEVIRNRDYAKKILFIVISNDDIAKYGNNDIHKKANIYHISGTTEYIKHWQSECKIIEEQIDSIGDYTLSDKYVEELKVIKNIQNGSIEFMAYLKDHSGISLTELEKSNYEEIISVILKGES